MSRLGIIHLREEGDPQKILGYSNRIIKFWTCGKRSHESVSQEEVDNFYLAHKRENGQVDLSSTLRFLLSKVDDPEVIKFYELAAQRLTSLLEKYDPSFHIVMGGLFRVVPKGLETSYANLEDNVEF